MSRYHLYTCPNCESSFRVVWPEQLPKGFHLNSKITITCRLCGERRELYVHLLDVITCAPNPDRATVNLDSIPRETPTRIQTHGWNCSGDFATEDRPVQGKVNSLLKRAV